VKWNGTKDKAESPIRRGEHAQNKLSQINRTVCHPEERRIIQETLQRLEILFEEYWMRSFVPQDDKNE
jgi:hypothetical protein